MVSVLFLFVSDVFYRLCRRMCDRNLKQLINIKFLAKSGETATESYGMLKNVYGDEKMSRARVFEWHKYF